MHVYSGIGRRQVGGNIWATIQRGLKPILMNVLSKLKPLAVKAGRRAAGSAINVGTSIATDALSGKLNKNKLKAVMRQEVNKLKNEVQNKAVGYKRKFLDELQSGSGIPNKRRLIQKTSIKSKKKMPARKTSKRTSNNTQKRCKVYKRKQVKKIKKAISRKSKYITKRKRRTVSRKTISDIFGK